MQAPPITHQTAAPEQDFFLPNLCSVHAVFFLVIGTETGALIFTLIHSGLNRFDWNYFALISLFMLWIVLASAVILCQLRRSRFAGSIRRQALIVYAVVLSNTALIAILADLLVRQPGAPEFDTWFLIDSMLISAVLTGAILRYFYLHHLWHAQQRAELESRVEALQARIRPHFLFNSMNSIAGLIHEDSDAAEEAVLDLAELFRATLKETSQLVPIGEELGLCERYLRIEKLRLGARLTTEFKTASIGRQVLVPPLSIQPLVENAVYHGIQPNPKGGVITVETFTRDDCLYVMVSNPLASRPTAPKHQGNRLAIGNIQSRLKAFFGDRAVLKSSRHNNLYTATLRIPLPKTGAGQDT